LEWCTYHVSVGQVSSRDKGTMIVGFAIWEGRKGREESNGPEMKGRSMVGWGNWLRCQCSSLSRAFLK
jgi:hypothetical protein